MIKRFLKSCPALMVLSIIFWTSCRNTDKQSTPQPHTTPVLFDYKISGEEGKQQVVCLLQFRADSGRYTKLQKPSQVQLDGEELKADSTPFTGVYYEAIRPVKDFAGRHEILFTNADTKEYTTPFEFVPFSLAAALPEKIKRKPFIIKLKNTGDHQVFRLVMIDTSFASNDVNRVVEMTNNSIFVTDEMLSRLKKGPVFMEITGEEERKIQNSGFRGKITITYSLKRDFLLID